LQQEEPRLVTLLIYLAVFTVLSLLIFQRRDVGGS
jgi:hypothetical protein